MISVRNSYGSEALIMTQLLSDIAAVSSKGQVVLPKAMRDTMHIETGTKLMVISDGTSIILKPIPMPDLSEFQRLMEASAAWASEVGMTEEDISTAVKTVRRRRHE